MLPRLRTIEVFQRQPSLVSRLRNGAAAGALLATLPLTAVAGPLSGTVAAGTADITSPSATQTLVTQTTQRAVINWNSFDLAQGESIVFQQPSANAITLNRVTGGTTSVIAGSVTANGGVFLLNPRGVLVTAGATIDVNSLVMTTAALGDQDFMDGRYVFDGGAQPGSVIANEGAITVGQAGLAALVGLSTRNSGVITARLGTVALAAGTGFTLDIGGDGLFSFDLTGALDQASLGQAPTALVSNSGTVRADGGTVLLTAAQASRVVENAISIGGVIEANSASAVEGAIILEAAVGDVSITGRAAAVGDNIGERGGTVTARVEAVTVASGGTISVEGDAGGGSIAVGDAVGTVTADRVKSITIAEGGSVLASATRAGAGGQVTLAAETALAHAGQTKANGAAGTVGKGGSITMLSRGTTTVAGTVTAQAATGATRGKWTLTTGSVEVATGSAAVPDVAFVDAATVSGALNAVTDVTLIANATTLPGDITVSAALTRSGGAVASSPVLTLAAANDVTIAGAIQGSSGRSLNLVLSANSATVTTDGAPLAGSLLVTAPIASFGGSVTGTGVNFTNSAAISTNGGVLGLSQTGVIQVNAALSTAGASAGALALTGTTIQLGAGLSVSNAAIDVTGSVLLTADSTLSAGQGAVTITGSVDGAHALTLNSTGTARVTGAIGGLVPLTALTTDNGGRSILGPVSTAGAQTYRDAVTLSGSYVTGGGSFSSVGVATIAADSSIATAGGTVSFGNLFGVGTTLSVASGGANVSLAGVSGLAALTVGTGAAVRLNGGTYTLAGDGEFNFANTVLAGDIAFGSRASLGDAALAADSFVTGRNGLISFSSVTGTGRALTLTGNTLVGGGLQTGSLTLRGDDAAMAFVAELQTGALTVDASRLKLSLANGADIAGDLTLSSDTVLTATGAIKAGGNARFGSIALSGDLALQAADITIAGPVDGNAALTATATGALAMQSAAGGTVALSGATLSGATLSLTGLRTTGTQTVTGTTGIDLSGTYHVGTGDFIAAGPVRLTGDSQVNATADVTFAGTIDGAGTLSTVSGGSSWFKGDIGGTATPDGLAVSAGKGIRLGDGTPMALHVSGNTLFDGAVTLHADLSVAAADTRFTGAVTAKQAAAQGLDIVGSARFDGAVGGDGAALRSLLVAGPTTLAGGAVTTSGAQTYGATTVLAGTRLVAGDGGILFTSSVDGATDLTVRTSGTLEARGAIGTTMAVRSVDFDAGRLLLNGVTSLFDQNLNAGAAALSGSYRAGGNFRLSGPATLAGVVRVRTDGSATFAGTVDADAVGGSLEAAATGGINLHQDVGRTSALSALSLSGDIVIGAGAATRLYTTGTQTYDGNVVLAGDLLVRAGTDVTFRQRVDSAADMARSLIVNAGGAARFDGNIGVTRHLASLTTDAAAGTRAGDFTLTAADAAVGGGRTVLGNGAAGAALTVMTGGNQSYGDILELGADTLLVSGGDITAAKVVRADGVAARHLIANSAGDTRFLGAIGTEAGLASLATDAEAGFKAGGLTVDTVTARQGGALAVAGAVTTGAQVFNEEKITLSGRFQGGDRFTVAGAATLGAATQVDFGQNGQVQFAGTVDGAAGLSVRGGGVSLARDIGAATRLADIDIAGAGITMAGSVLTTGGQTFRATEGATLGGTRYESSGGSLLTTGPVRLTAPATRFASATGDVVFQGAVDGPAALTVSAGGTAGFAGGAGTQTALASLTVEAGREILLEGGSLRTSGSQSWRSAMGLGGDVQLSGDRLIFSAPVRSVGTVPASLAINGTVSVSFNGNVGVGTGSGAGVLRRLDVTAPSIFLSPAGSQSGGDATASTMIIRTAGPAGASGQRYAGTIIANGDRIIFDTTGDGAVPSGIRGGRDPITSAMGGDLRFDHLSADSTAVVWRLGSGSVHGASTADAIPTIAVRSLDVLGNGGEVRVEGTVAGLTGAVAAQRVVKSYPRSNSYRLNDCAMGNPSCIVVNFTTPQMPEATSRPAFPEPERVMALDPTGIIRGNEDLWREDQKEGQR